MNPQHIRQQLYKLIKSRMALSAIVTTLIILVIAVLLAGVVAYFSINVTSTRVQEENLVLSKRHVWFDEASDTAQAAIMVINTGGRDVVVGKLTVRGQTVAWANVFVAYTADTVSGDLPYKAGLANNAHITIGGVDRVFTTASNGITLKSGETLIIYLKNPDSISVNDVGLTVSINLFTSQAMYYKETNVQGTT